MKRQVWGWAAIALIVPQVLQGCASETTPTADAPAADTEETVAADPAAESTGEKGTLQFRANGEDFVRQGFVTKDGWAIDFENVYVSLADVTAYQTDPPYDPDSGEELTAKAEAAVGDPVTVDLAEGDENAEPILISELEAPAGQYNALGWQMVPAADGPAAGNTVLMVGTAEKDGRVINFNIGLDPAYAYTCGEFVGDERKGILAADDTADVEATFHFDHIFGDGDAPPDDDINTGALGFEPLAALAEGDQLDVDMATLEEQLSDEDYSTLEKTVSGLAHVGEGHCAEAPVS
ncbi:MAG: hypothetical protein VKK04_24285 [Synechococcales bacterium]|nr:hypothetical protein [Synechococcales bacterium]